MADIGRIKDREIIEEMQDSYIDYAMSVIVARALPDVRSRNVKMAAESGRIHDLDFAALSCDRYAARR